MYVHETEGGQRGWSRVSRAGTGLVRHGGRRGRMTPQCQDKAWISLLSPLQNHWRILINILNILVYIWKISGLTWRGEEWGAKKSGRPGRKLQARENGALNWVVLWKWRKWAEGGGREGASSLGDGWAGRREAWRP